MSFASDIGRMVARGPQRQLTEQETMTLLQLTMMCEEPPEAQIDLYKMMLSKSMALKILDSRFRAHLGDTVKFSPPMMVWLSTLTDRPGQAVLMVAVLAHALEEGRELSLGSLVGSYFMDGIPTGVCYQLAWDAQKITEERAKAIGVDGTVNGPDNVLDYAEAWK